MEFKKEVFDLEQSIKQIINHGIVMNTSDKIRAKRYLRTIGYYRLSGYFPPFYTPETSTFIAQTTFDDILNLYIFDRKLRLLVMDAMERIEVAVRTIISDTLATYYNNSHWFLDLTIFNERYNIDNLHKKIVELTGKNKPSRQNGACAHYYKTYKTPELPACWMITETLTMGVWSSLFSGLQGSKVKQKISKQFNLNSNDLGSWLHEITLIRNNCAHHSRFWNTSYSLKCRNVPKYTHKDIPLRSSYVKFVIIQYFIKQLFHSSTWSQKLKAHLDTCPLDIETHMRFPANWDKRAFWQTK